MPKLIKVGRRVRVKHMRGLWKVKEISRRPWEADLVVLTQSYGIGRMRKGWERVLAVTRSEIL